MRCGVATVRRFYRTQRRDIHEISDYCSLPKILLLPLLFQAGTKVPNVMEYSSSDHPPIPEQRILRSIILPLGVAIIVLMLAVVCGVVWLMEKEDRAQVGRVVSAAERLLDIQLDEEEETLKVSLAGITSNSAFAAPLRATNRGDLQRLALPIYTSIHPEAQVTHFYFGTADGTTILRVHAPSRYGDTFDNGLTAKAARTGKPEGGLQIGHHGALSLRVSAPYRDGNEVLGYVQHGIEFQHILDTIHQALGVDVITLISKQRLVQAEWERGRSYFKWSEPWDRFPSVVMNNSTMSPIPDAVVSHMATAPADGDITASYISDHGRIFYVAPLPLRDEAGERLGSVVVVADRTELITGSRLLIGAIVVLCLGIATMLIVVFRRIISDVEQKIRRSIAGKARAHADFERVAFMACHDLQEPLEQVITASLELKANPALLEDSGSSHVELIADGACRLENVVGTLEDYVDLHINGRAMEVLDLYSILAAAVERIDRPKGWGEVIIHPLPKALGRPIPVARAVLSILEFAVRVRPSGGSVPLVIRAKEENGECCLWFSGLPTDILKAEADILNEAPELAAASRSVRACRGTIATAEISHDIAAIVLRLCSVSDISE